MLKTCGSLTRFMDGLALNFAVDFLYLKDISNNVRIGKSAFCTNSTSPSIVIEDQITGKTLKYEGDYLKLDSHDSWQFAWFPSIEEGAVLYDGFNNDKRYNGIEYAYISFLAGELFYNVVSSGSMDLPVGNRERRIMVNGLASITSLYAHSLQLLYSSIIGNQDYLLLLNKPTSSKSQVKTLDIDVTGTSTLTGLLKRPDISKHLTNGGVNIDGVYYDTSDKIMEKLRAKIPERVLENSYHEFRREIDAKKWLSVIRSENPLPLLEERMKALCTTQSKSYTISFNNPEMDLEIANRA